MKEVVENIKVEKDGVLTIYLKKANEIENMISSLLKIEEEINTSQPKNRKGKKNIS